MLNPKELENLIDSGEFQLLKNGVTDVNPVDVADLIEGLPAAKAVLLFRVLPKDYAAAVFANLYSETQESIVGLLSDNEISNVVEKLFLDDAADFVDEMPATIAKKILAHATPETREQINTLLKYKKDSAGTKMTVEFVSLKRTLTVAQAFERIRKVGTEKETIYTCYVTNSERILEGVITAKKLLLSDPEQLVGDIMDTNLVMAHTDEDREAVARLFERYDFLTIPVVDSESRLVGIITIDDIIDVVEEEATEDFEKMAGMSPSDKPYLKTGIVKLARNRMAWLTALMLASILTGAILEAYETALAEITMLMFFVPMLMDTGGNSGAQSSTMVIRGLALGDVLPRDFFRIIWKELRVGMLAGTLLAAVNVVRILIQYGFDGDMLRITIVVSVTLLFTVVLANVVGGVLPIAAKKVKVDPALMAAPLITTIVDVSALLVYFAMAKMLLGV